jgi:hypothetical protein
MEQSDEDWICEIVHRTADALDNLLDRIITLQYRITILENKEKGTS